MLRRTFLQVLAGTGILIPTGKILLNEPEIETTIKHKWVIDKGAYYEVWIPERQELSKEIFDKPIILFMGNQAKFRDCTVEGFASAYTKYGALISNTVFSVGNYLSTRKDRPIFTLEQGYQAIISRCSFNAAGTSRMQLLQGLNKQVYSDLYD